MAAYEFYNPFYNTSNYVPPQYDNNKFIWVQGKEGAKAYPTAPGMTLLFLDDQNPYIYKKITDREGRTAEFHTYKLVEEFEGKEEPHYITKQELEAELSDLVKALEPRLFDPNRKRRNNNGKPANE